jgi:probable F420-dependent oxidoreductase
MTDPAYFAPLAQAAEEAGFDTFLVPDSICYPEVSDSTYPYTPDGNREFLDGKPFLEPFSLIPALGAVTSTIRFATFVLKLPIRPPVLTAKQAASVAVLTGNRLVLGVGISPWPEDFDVLGVPFDRRGKRLDECIAIIRGLCDPDGGYYEHDGEVFDVQSIKIAPVPSQPIPILIGGHTEPALARAARIGDGWMAAGADPELLAHAVATTTERRKEAGRDHLPFEIHSASLDVYAAEGVARAEEQGITDAVVGFRWPYEPGPDTEPLQQKLDAIRRYGDDVIANVR